MELKKIKKLKQKNEKINDKTSRNQSILSLGIERYVRLSDVINVYKKAFYIFLFTTILFMATSIYLLNKTTVYPYLIKVNDKGEIHSIESLKHNKIEIGNREIEYFLKKFIVNTRQITLDKKFYENNIKNMSYFLTTEAKRKLENFLSEDNLYEFFEQKITRDIEILSFIKLTSNENQYQIRWREKTYDSNGNLIIRKNLNSIMSIELIKPSVEQIEINPFGILITDFNVTKEN